MFAHLIVTLARRARPGEFRSVAAESVLARHQLLILNSGRRRAPDLRATDRIIAGLCTLFMSGTRPSFLHRSEAFHSARSPPWATQTKVPHVVFRRGLHSELPSEMARKMQGIQRHEQDQENDIENGNAPLLTSALG